MTIPETTRPGRHRALANRGADFDRRDVFYQHRRARRRFDHDLSNLLFRPLAVEPSQPAHGVAFRTSFDVAAAEVAVAHRERVIDVAQRQVVREQAFGFDQHVILLDEAAPRIDSLTPGTARSCGLIVQSWSVFNSIAPVVFAFDHVLIDLAESRRHRAERGLQSFGNARLRLLQTLVDHLPREVGVHAVGEDDGDDREAELEIERTSSAPRIPNIALSIG